MASTMITIATLPGIITTTAHKKGGKTSVITPMIKIKYQKEKIRYQREEKTPG